MSGRLDHVGKMSLLISHELENDPDDVLSIGKQVFRECLISPHPHQYEAHTFTLGDVIIFLPYEYRSTLAFV